MEQNVPLVRRFSKLEPYQEAYTLVCSLEPTGSGCWLSVSRTMARDGSADAARAWVPAPQEECARLLDTLDATGTQAWLDFRKEYGLERKRVTIGRLIYALESKLSQQEG